MLVRARITFSGIVSMVEGEERNLKEGYVLRDLLGAGYVEPVAIEAEVVEKPVENVQPDSVKPVENKVEKSKKTSTKKKKSKR